MVFYLLPQRFILPPTGKTHHGGLHHWVSAQERSEVLNEGVLGIDAVEPIGNAAKLRIETVDGEKADVVEDGYSLFLIFKNKPSLFQYVYLFSEGDGLLCIFHIKRNVPPWSAGLATRSVVGFVGAKVRLLFGIAKLFQRKVNFPLVFSRFSESTRGLS